MRLLAAIVATFALLGVAFAEAPPKIEVGEPFPEILLPSLDTGEAMSIKRFRGEKVVLHIFASW